MELSLQEYERIQKYLDGEMQPEAEKLFLDDVNDNKTLQEYLQFEQELRLNLDLINEPSLSEIDFNIENRFDDAPYIKSLIEKAGNEWQKENKTKSPSGSAATKDIKEKKIAKTITFPLWVSIAAAACLVFAVAGIVWFMANKSGQQSIANNKKVDSAKKKNDNKTEIAVAKPKDSLNDIPPSQLTVNFAALYKKFYKKDKTPEPKPELLAEALIDYENADYKTLQNLDMANLSTTLGTSGNDINSDQNVKELGHFYKGLAFMQTNQVKQASDNLQWVIDSAQNKQLIVKAQWYQALVYIKKGNTNKALPLLTTVTNNKATPYNRQAKELLQLLKQ